MYHLILSEPVLAPSSFAEGSQEASLAAAPGLAKEVNAGQGAQQTAVAAASCSCPAQSPRAASLLGSGWSIHSANSLFPFQDSPRDTREWQSLL